MYQNHPSLDQLYRDVAARKRAKDKRAMWACIAMAIGLGILLGTNFPY